MPSKSRDLILLMLVLAFVIAAVVTLIPNVSPRNNDLGYSSLCPFAPWSTLVLLAGAGISLAVRSHLAKPDAPRVRI